MIQQVFLILVSTFLLKPHEKARQLRLDHERYMSYRTRLETRNADVTLVVVFLFSGSKEGREQAERDTLDVTAGCRILFLFFVHPAFTQGVIRVEEGGGNPHLQYQGI